MKIATTREVISFSLEQLPQLQAHLVPRKIIVAVSQQITSCQRKAAGKIEPDRRVIAGLRLQDQRAMTSRPCHRLSLSHQQLAYAAISMRFTDPKLGHPKAVIPFRRRFDDSDQLFTRKGTVKDRGIPPVLQHRGCKSLLLRRIKGLPLKAQRPCPVRGITGNIPVMPRCVAHADLMPFPRLIQFSYLEIYHPFILAEVSP